MGTRRNRSEFSAVTHLTALFLYLSAAYFAVPSVAAAPLSIEVIELRHSLVADILPIIRPLVAPGGSATGMGNQLIVKTTPANFVDLKTVIAKFDRPAKMLRITVRQNLATASVTREHAVSGSIDSGNVGAHLPDSGSSRGAQIGIGDGNGNVLRYRTQDSSATDATDNTHFVTTIDGRPALIQTGKSTPVHHQSAVYGRRGVHITDDLEYRDSTSGFYVTPRVNNGQVSLSIAPQMQRLDRSSGVIDSRYSETSVTGRLGEWIALGGMGQSISRDDRALLTHTRRGATETYDVWVKVEELP